MANEFIYPYNFVPPPEMGDNQAPERRPFVPHDSLSGLAGRISFKLRTLTPLFIPDPERTCVWDFDRSKHHRFMRFFEVDGELCIPGSSLRGMIRSLAEAVTGSSMTVRGAWSSADESPDSIIRWREFDPCMFQERFLGVLRKSADDTWTIEPYAPSAKVNLERLARTSGHMGPLDTFKIGQLHNKAVQCDVAHIHNGVPLVTNLNIGADRYSLHATGGAPRCGTYQTQYQRTRQGHVNQSYITETTTGQVYQVRIADCDHLAGQAVDFWAEDFRGYPAAPGRDHRVWKIQCNGIQYGGIATITGRLRVRRNWDEGWRDPVTRTIQNRIRYVYVFSPIPAGHPVAVPRQVLARAKQAHPEDAKQLFENGDGFVYYEADAETGDARVIGPCCIFKTLDDHMPKEIAARTTSYQPPKVPKASAEMRLCPATRLFGHVFEGANARNYAGRLCFNMGRSEATPARTHPVQLATLGQPKHSYYPFYLTTDTANAAEAPLARYSGTMPTARIRGRKFYWHHRSLRDANHQQWQDLIGIPAAGAAHWEETPPCHPFTSQNSTVWPCECDVEFETSIDFHNLEPAELGLLLWCLGKGWTGAGEESRHALKLGMGKPLGLGSVQVDDVRVHVLPEDWLGNLGAARKPASDDDIDKWVTEFKRATIPAGDDDEDQVAHRFGRLHRVRVLGYMLDFNFPPDGAPRPSYRPPALKADRGYAYFSAQRQRRVNGQLEEPLLTPRQIADGREQRHV